MMVWSINLLVLSVGFILVGIFKPQWLLFWMEKEKPPRLPIFIMALLLFMAGTMMFGEANMEKKNALAAKEAAAKPESKTDTLPTVAPEKEPISLPASE